MGVMGCILSREMVHCKIYFMDMSVYMYIFKTCFWPDIAFLHGENYWLIFETILFTWFSPYLIVFVDKPSRSSRRTETCHSQHVTIPPSQEETYIQLMGSHRLMGYPVVCYNFNPSKWGFIQDRSLFVGQTMFNHQLLDLNSISEHLQETGLPVKF